MFRLVVLAIPLMLPMSVSAIAGDRVTVEHAPTAAAFKNEVRVRVSMSFNAPAAADDSEASVKARERARRMLYESAGKECDVLRAMIASECRLEGININVRTNRRYGQQAQGLNASGNFSYRINLKQDGASP